MTLTWIFIAARPNSVIDLTGDDDEDTTKAIVASMETQTTFGPSNRVDETQQWAVVPSNVSDGHLDICRSEESHVF